MDLIALIGLICCTCDSVHKACLVWPTDRSALLLLVVVLVTVAVSP